MNLTAKSLTRILSFTWIFFFAAHLMVVIILSEKEWIGDKTFYTAIKTINGLYAPYLGSLLLFFWSKRHVTPLASDASFGLLLMLVSSLLWNLIISVFLFPVLFGSGNLPGQLEKVENVSGVFSWLVAGAFGFYFGSSK